MRPGYSVIPEERDSRDSSVIRNPKGGICLSTSATSTTDTGPAFPRKFAQLKRTTSRDCPRPAAGPILGAREQSEMPPPPLAPLPPALLRVQKSETAWDSKGRGKAKESAVLGERTTRTQLLPPSTAELDLRIPAASSSTAQHASTAPHRAPEQLHPSSSSRRVGLLGIPISDTDDESGLEAEDSVFSSESLEANPPVSPLVAAGVPPAPTYSRGGSTRSGPSSRADRQSEGVGFVSEQNFRDIVDDLTLQNQQLKSKLKRFESARVPSSMKNERLFEVRFFEGLPKTRRREIELFLTEYVQTLSASDSQRGSTGSFSSRAFPNGEEPSNSGRDHGDSISSIGRSLRSSEKDAIARTTVKADADALKAAGSLKGSRGSGSGTGSRSGSGSGQSKEKRKRRADGVPQYNPPPSHEPLGSTPIAIAAHVADPPSLLRRPTDSFPPDRDVLAAASFSGIEPVSTTGTGHEMRISDPNARKRKRHGSAPSNDNPKEKHRRPHSIRTSSTSGSVTSHDFDTLEHTIVQMIECLFLESLPFDREDEPASPPVNPLKSEPYPLPARSSSNTQYLRTILSSEEHKHVGGWVYLNIVATFAALHRLATSISTVRHALRTKSDLIEVSADGSKIRWKGPTSKPSKKALKAQTEAVEECTNELEEIREHDAAQMRIEGRDRRSRSPSSSAPPTESIFDDQHSRPALGFQNGSSTFATSTAPTSLNPTNSKTGSGSKNGSEWHTAGSSSNGTRAGGTDKVHLRGSDGRLRIPAPLPQGFLYNNSSLRNTVEEVGSPARRENEETVEALGAGAEVPPIHRYQYTPLFAQRTDSPSSSSEDLEESGSEDVASDGFGDIMHSRKRRKGYEGGVVYFANDLFCSDLAGDFEVRVKLQRADESARSSSLALGGTLSPDDMDIDEDIDSASRSGITGSIASESKHSEEVVDKKEDEDEEERDHRERDSYSVCAEDGLDIVDPDEVLLDFIENNPPTPEMHSPDAYLSAPRPALRLSAMSEAVASDHFTIHTKYRYRSLNRHSGSSPASSAASACLRPFARPSLSAHKTLFTSDFSPQLFVSLARPTLVESKTLHHHPAVFARPPRVLMSLSSDGSDSGADSDESSSVHRRPREGQVVAAGDRRRTRRLKNTVMRGHRFEGPNGGGDYLMSLALPLNRWAPVTKRSTPSVGRLSSSRVGTGSGEPSESLITLD
ncbi:uncharacterized protein JCM15063_005724 [Sporobolomyces koalae]|uniref:uncharacterized protein n=1 Tax=Sporobolomyces koalae TaxID=500713 RepID=UPI00318194B4